MPTRLAFLIAVVSAAFWCPATSAQGTGTVAVCQAACNDGCSLLSDDKKHAMCLAQCRANCLDTPPPPPLTVQAKYLLLTILYAPPGCAGGAPTCGASLSSDFVDYGAGSSFGTKTTTANSFKAGETITADAGPPLGSVGGSISVTGSSTDTKSLNITKTNTFDMKLLASASDGVDHGQDQFVLLLNPTVTLSGRTPNLHWALGNSDSVAELYTVYAYELRNPTSMRPAVAQQLQARGFTTDDYNTILGQDPFGGSVVTGNRPWYGGTTGINASNAPLNGARSALPSPRFVPTAWALPYEPTGSCGAVVCSCSVVSYVIKNDLVNDATAAQSQDYNVSFKTSAGVPDVWDLKTDTELTWTNSSSNESISDSNQSATVSIGCPSSNYTGPTIMQVFWDTVYSSFVFQPIQLNGTSLLQRGHVVDALGKSLSGRLVVMTYGSKTYRTYTSTNGTYQFYDLLPSVRKGRSARVTVGKVSKSVTVGSSSEFLGE